MIAQTSGSCTALFTGDSAFLYSVIKRTANVLAYLLGKFIR